MHMLRMLMGMHMHPMLRIRFDRDALIPAPAAHGWIEARRAEEGIGAEAWRKGHLWIQKTPGVQRRQASRVLALCFTWRQEAANHHDFDCARQSRAMTPRRQGHGPRILSVLHAIAPPRIVPVIPSSSVTQISLLKVVSRVRGVHFSASVTPVSGHACGGFRVLAAGLGNEYISVHRRRHSPFRRPVPHLSHTVT
jgi:hypothetical protein